MPNKYMTLRSAKFWSIIAIIVIAAGIALYFTFRSKKVENILPTVEVETVTTDNVNIYGEYVGKIRAQQFVEIHARVEGYLENMLFKEGSYIKKGQTLFVIDPRLYKANVDKARAHVNKARANKQKAERDLN
ncbi:efflux RND transporter periplasmic adaptor subunit, partial [uncultured Duncaniella sp.]